MQIKIKSLLFGISLFFNLMTALLFIFASAQKTAHISFPDPGRGYVAAGIVASVPSGGNAVFQTAEISLKPRQKAFLQISVVADKKQANFLINALYDHEIISAAQTAYGIEITALRPGETSVQILANDGFRTVALVAVEEAEK